MITKKVADALRNQLKNELESSYLYLSMSAWAAGKGLKGFSNWFYVQAKEEMYHFFKFYHYLLDQGEKVELPAVAKPKSEFSSPLEAMRETLQHEQFITKSINELVDVALSEKDHATNAFLQWFISEQVEEEASVGEILDQLELIGENGNGIFMIDKELGQRTFVTPTDLAL
ncbi:ferritin [Deferribacterales bacterium Es71-Z0220]|jgi:ferritin|uniref:ferritin n=1 Tax=Deferrivibrio essentukiensis TaxID=2880922 RepID=UPI001F60ECAA|nr:ferritin [Deferrivibrio essentukiensis]MCB4203953.1 ferritin [Deferrivibrio essentukiensis]